MKTLVAWLAERQMPGKRHQTEEDLKKFESLRDSDVVRVYHGFRDFHLALRAIAKGLSGQEIVGRNYSYESNNNPKGLFVTTEFDVAKEFSGAYGVATIIEFHCKVKDLEAPVWPNGGYTVQGQMSGMFHSDEDREAARLKARDAAKSAKHVLDNVKQSDRPELAQLMMASREFQALFIGHLNPNMIRAVWIREPENGYQRTSTAFTRMSRGKFLSKFGKTPIDWGYEENYEDRMLLPNDEWDAAKFVKNMANRFYNNPKRKFRHENPEQEIVNSSKYLEDHQLLRYVWPKQYSGAVKWLHGIKKNEI